MPPKKAPAPSKKTEMKKKEKVIEDKTFGLKNKKGAKQQKFIQQVEKQVKPGTASGKGVDPNAKKLEKEKKLKEQKELALLFKPVQNQKIDMGTDPKSVICAFFKQGQCAKGDRCKFSHDLAVERKAEKRSLYCDMRDIDKETDTMDKWDENKLKEVVEKKHGAASNKPTTDIICKHFLKAVEKSKYGWFWECPSGGRCIYRHALPPGFVLKKDLKKEDKKEEISLEDLIERERANLGVNQTKITLETFLAWKKRKLHEKKEKAIQDEEKKRNDYRAGRQVGISGREMFSFNPELAAGDGIEDGDEAIDSYQLEDEDSEEIEYRDLDIDKLACEARALDATGITLARPDRLKNDDDPRTNGDTASAPVAEEAAALTINEDLFAEEDLEGLEEELGVLDLEE